MKKKLAAIATAAPLALMLASNAALATTYAAPADPSAPAQGQYEAGGDLACVTLLGPAASPEDLQAEAQAVLLADPSDPNGLDADSNGIPCEFSQEASGEVVFEDGSGFVSDSASQEAPAPPQQDLSCVGLLDSAEPNPEQGTSPEGAQAQAQAVLAEDPTDPNGLDADGDGVACEFEVRANGEVAFEDGTRFAEVVDFAAPPVAEPSEPSADVAPVAPSPSADGPTLQPAVQEDVVPAPRAEAPQSSSSPAPAPMLSPEPSPATEETPAAAPRIRELPATGGATVFPVFGAPGSAGTALVGTALLALAAKRRPPGV